MHGRWPYLSILNYSLIFSYAQQPAQLLPQQLWQPPADPHPPRGQWLPHGAAAETAAGQEPVQFVPHVDCEQDVPLVQLHLPVHCPDCPRVNPIPARSRTINISAIFLKSNTHFCFFEPAHGSRTTKSLVAYGYLDLGKCRCNQEVN